MKKYIVVGNGVEWCEETWENEIKNNNHLIFFNGIVPYTGREFLHKICKIHYSKKINSRFKLPLKSIWYKNFMNTLKISNDDNEYILIIYDWSRLSFDYKFLIYLRNKVKNIKIAYMFTNVVRATGAIYYNILDTLSSCYDKVFAFDYLDAKKYNFNYSPLIYTRGDENEIGNIKSDLFYIGQAKDRYNDLIDIFEHAKNEGLICDFHIVGVPKELQKYQDEIIYNETMTYKEVLEHIKSTKCIVDATQGNSSGYTIKVCEAVMFNKKLISSNKYIKNAPFFDNQTILEYPFVQDILIKEFINTSEVDYNDDAKMFFSPSRLFRAIED